MLILILLLLVFLSSRLLDDKLHCFDTQSHFRVHLYLNSVQVIVQKLAEANELTQWIIYSFLERQLADLNAHTTV